jgi:hypothetical protein
VVALKALHRVAQARASRNAKRFDIGQRGVPVKRWLPLTQQVEIGAVEDEDFHGGWPFQ